MARRLTIGVVIVVLVTASGVHAQIAGEGNRVVILQRLIQAAFPELIAQHPDVTLTLETNAGVDWNLRAITGISVREQGRPWKPRLSEQDPPSDDLLQVFGDFSPDDGFISAVHFSGRYVKSREVDALDEMVRSHEEWTNAQVVAAIAKAGANFGPDHREEFLRQLDIQRFANIVGPIQTFRASFEWLQEGAPRRAEFMSTPLWAVTFRTFGHAGQTICYTLGFEPFEGRLYHVLAGVCS
jgi:hypothetical protein